MNFSDVFIDSLRYPFSDLRRLIILLLLFMGSFLLIPGLIAYGYILRIIESTLKGEDSLPDFSYAGTLFVDGLKFAVVSIIYGIPVLVLNFILMKQTSLNSLITDYIGADPLFTTITFVIGFLVSLVFVTALANMVHEERFGAAFAFKRIFQLIKMIGWKKYLAYILVYTIIVNLIMSVPTLILYFLNPFMIYNSFTGILGVTLVGFIFSAYMLAFEGRFRGLIYPIKENEELESDGKV